MAILLNLVKCSTIRTTNLRDYCTIAAICVSFHFLDQFMAKTDSSCIKMCKMTPHSCLYPDWLQRYGINYMA